MRILYMSCHSVLEHDEVSLFHEMGLTVFSPGAYVEPNNPGDSSLRPGIPGLEYDPADLAAWHKLAGQVGGDPKGKLSKEFVDRFDAIVVMHIPEWIVDNWAVMKHKTVIWRTIGQAMPHQEKMLQKYRTQGLKIVRYSPREFGLNHFCGYDAVIRFYKDPDLYKGWVGTRKKIINFTQAMPQRGPFCNWALFQTLAARLPVELYGPGNEAAGELNKGRLTFAQQLDTLQQNRAYLYTGTHPASYTLNGIECLMVGTPMVAIGPYHGNGAFHKRPDHVGDPDIGCLYEMPDIIQNGVNGFISDNVDELVEYFQLLLQDDELAQRISEAGRVTAIRLFGKEKIRDEWSRFFASL